MHLGSAPLLLRHRTHAFFFEGLSVFRASSLAATSQKGKEHKRGKEQGHRSLHANRAQKDPGRTRPFFLKAVRHLGSVLDGVAAVEWLQLHRFKIHVVRY